MTNLDETIAHNESHMDAMLKRQAVANRTGGTCPKCGGGANPSLLAAWGHCIKCQNATVGR